MRLNPSRQAKLKRAIRLDRAIHLVWKSAPQWTTLSIVFLIVQGGLPLLSLYLMKAILDGVTVAISAADKNLAFKHVAFLIGCAGGVVLISDLCRSLVGLVKDAQSQLITDHVNDVLHAKSIAVDLEYYENSQYYNVLHRAQLNAPYRPPQIVDGLAQIGQSSISLLAITGLLFSFNAIVAAILFVAAIPALLIRIKYAGLAYRCQSRWTPNERRADYYNWLLTSVEFAKEIRLFNLGETFKRRFQELRRQIRLERLQMVKKSSLAELAPHVMATLAVFGSLAFIAHQTVYGVISLGSMVMYFQAFQRGQSYIGDMMHGLAAIYQNNLFLSDFYEFLDLKPRVIEPLRSAPFPQPLKSGIVFDRVGFHYPNDNREVLKNVSLTIAPGETVALVGENGSGKTTLIKLLCRLYDPNAGKITIDGVDLRNYSTAALRHEIGIIFQDYSHYNLSAKENIWLGNIDLPADHDRIDFAAQQAGAHEVIRKLPEGYQTVLGYWFEKGTELSVGEWQKIALARAFLREAQLIVLDEPTSAIDARAEYEFFQKFRQLTRGRTVVLVSHRLSTVRMANRIYFMAGGTIAEAGTHDQLIQCGGAYARLYEMQAQNYR